MIQSGWHVLAIVWTSPNSLLGLCFGSLGLISGGSCRVRAGCLEFFGGWVTAMLRAIPLHPAALTLGHTILGMDACGLDRARQHELVHVRQYERWGPFFLPAYLSCSGYLWLMGRRAYRDNPFEVEAYNASDAGSNT